MTDSGAESTSHNPRQEWLWTVEAQTSISPIEEPIPWTAVGRHRADAKQTLARTFPYDRTIVKWGETSIRHTNEDDNERHSPENHTLYKFIVMEDDD